MTTKLERFPKLFSTGLLAAMTLTQPLLTPMSLLAEENLGTRSDPIEVAKPAYLNVCNQFGQATALYVAVAYFDQGGWRSKGWWSVQPSRCAKISVGEGSVWYYAKGSNGLQWTSDNTFCVNLNSRFDIPNSRRNARNQCRGALQGVGMREVRIRGGQTYSLNFR